MAECKECSEGRVCEVQGVRLTAVDAPKDRDFQKHAVKIRHSAIQRDKKLYVLSRNLSGLYNSAVLKNLVTESIKFKTINYKDRKK